MKQPNDLALYLSSSVLERYGIITAHVCRATTDGSRNVRWNSESYSDSADYEGLVISAQYDVGKDGLLSSYAWCFEYQGRTSVDLEKAERMLKTLRRLERAMLKTPPASNFTDYLFNAMRALGCSYMNWMSSWDSRGVDHYRDNFQLRGWVESEEKEFLQLLSR